MKKAFTTIAVVATLAAASAMNTTVSAADTPAISVSIVGDTIINNSAEYTIIYEGDVSLVTISEKSIGLEGFTADKSVTVKDDDKVTPNGTMLFPRDD